MILIPDNSKQRHFQVQKFGFAIFPTKLIPVPASPNFVSGFTLHT
jgi:hypothetical protein